MSTTSETTTFTADQLAKMPADGVRREIVQGELRMMSPAGGRHGVVALRLGHYLLQHVKDRELGYVFAAETGFLLSQGPDTVRAPDVAFVRRDRIESIDEVTGFVPLAPDLVAEVVSPSDSFSEVEEKVLCWLQHGVSVVLVVDPGNRTCRISHVDGRVAMLNETEVISVEEILPAWRLDVASLFD